MKLCLLIWLILFNVYSSVAQEPEWLGKIESIEILKSTQNNILSIFGKPENSTYAYYKTYYLNEGKMTIEYSEGLCKSQQKEGWNVPEFTVTRIFFTPSKLISPQELGVNLDEYKKQESHDVPGAFGYENEEKGISFDLKTSGGIEMVEFYPSKKLSSLSCEK